MRAANTLSILSLGYTRSLWDVREGNDNVRLRAYADSVGRYTHVVNSRWRHNLAPLQFAKNCRAIATNGWTPLDNFFRLILCGHRELKRCGYDLIQAQDPSYMGLAACVLGWWHGLPVNVCVYGPNPWDPAFLRTSLLNRLLAPVARFVLRRCAGVQVDGRLALDSLRAHGIAAEKIYCKPMIPSDVGDFFRIERAPRTDDAPVTLLFAGRLVPQKNLAMLVRAFARVRTAAGSAVRLRLVGQGPLHDEIRDQVRAAGLEAAVDLPGAVDRAGILREFAEADVFVLSSTYEGYPRVLVEAAAAGVPVVATRVGGADEMIADQQTGYIVPVGDEDAFVSALAVLASDRAHRERLGAAARAHATERVSRAARPDEQIRIWTELVERVSKKP